MLAFHAPRAQGLRPSSLRAVLQGLGHLTDLNLGACSSASSTACSSSSLLAPSGAAAAGEEGAAALGQAPGRQEGEGHTVAAAAAAGPAPDMTAAFSVTDRCVLEVARSKVPLRAIGLAQCVHLADPGEWFCWWLEVCVLGFASVWTRRRGRSPPTLFGASDSSQRHASQAHAQVCASLGWR